MRQFIIQGGRPLKGEVEISGAKNAAAAILAAAMLCDGVCVIDNLPYISDVVVMAELIEHMGARVELSPSGRITIDSSGLENKTPAEHMVSRMRASSYLMGVLLGKWGKANVPPPGGCCAMGAALPCATGRSGCATCCAPCAPAAWNPSGCG